MERRILYVRTGSMAALTVAVALVFLGLLWYHQLYIGMDEAALAALTTTTRTETIPAARGAITDRNGTVLVDSQTQYRITLDVTQMGDYATQGSTILRLLELCQYWGEEWTDRELPISKTGPYTFTETPTRLGQLCQTMGWEQSTDCAELLAQMKATFSLTDGEEELTRAALGVLYSCYLREKELLWTEYTFADNAGIGLITAIGEETLPGVEITPVSVRTLQTTYAAHLLGRVGQSGVECAFETDLLGQEGKRTVTTDRSGNILSEEETISPCKGADVTLTLDADLQQVAEDALAQYVPQLNGGTGGGAAVVVSVADGGILACASYPTYDLQTMTYDPSIGDLSPFFNRALQGVYSPGSTFKMVTAVAGLETGVIDTASTIPCTGYLDYYGTVFRCWLYRERGETHAGETVAQALQDSCNIFFYQLGIALGIDTLTDYAKAFGLGEATGVELGESTGVNAGPDYSNSVGGTWYPGNLLSAVIGQSDNLFTPLQIANYIATLVNGGTRYAAHLLLCVTYADGTVEEYQPQVLGRVELSEATLNAVKAGMRGVVTNTAAVSRAFSDLEEKGIAVGAKTGSAQVTGQENANGLFVCFAPYDTPEVAVCVAVEQGGSGAATAVIAAQILEAYFNIQEETAPAPAG